MENLGERIKYYRKKRNLTQQQLADKINKSKSTIQKYESNEVTPGLDTICELGKILNENPTALFKASDIIDRDDVLMLESLGLVKNGFLDLEAINIINKDPINLDIHDKTSLHELQAKNELINFIKFIANKENIKNLDNKTIKDLVESITEFTIGKMLIYKKNNKLD